MFAMPHAPISTHTGISNSSGRRVPVIWFFGQWMQKSDAAASLAGCTREWTTFTDVKVNDKAWESAVSVGQNGLTVGQKVRSRETGVVGIITGFDWCNGKCVKAHYQEIGAGGTLVTSLPVNLMAA